MVSRGTTQQSSAPFNRRIVLDVIRRRGEASRKDLIDTVGLSPQTIANITQDLEDLDLIVSKRQKGEKVRGQPPMAFTLNPEGGDAIGLSLELNGLSAARVNLVGEMRDRRHVSVDLRDPTTALVAMIKQVEALRDNGGSHRIWGVGVAMPGPFDAPDLSFKGPTVFEKWRGLEIFAALEDAVGLPVFYNVDSVAGAVGESLFGNARDANRFFYLYMGVGLGGALMIDRAAYSGANGNATEVGHIPVVPDGRPCSCGNRGCLETYLSLHALSEDLGDGPLSAEEIVTRLAAGDEGIHNWCRSVAPYLRQVVCTIENMLDPQTIVLGGTAPPALWQALVGYAQPWLHSVRSGGGGRDAARVVVSDQGGDSALLGAAVLPIYEKLAPRVDALTLTAGSGRDDSDADRQKAERRFAF